MPNSNETKYEIIAQMAELIYNEISELSLKTAKKILSGNKKIISDFKKKQDFFINKLNKILKSENFSYEKYNCKICRDTGKIDGKICLCKKNILKKELLEKIESSYPKCKFSNFDLGFYANSVSDYNNNKHEKAMTDREVMEITLSSCIDYAKNFNLKSDNLLMTGKTGLGKTHLSLAIMREIIINNFNFFDVIYISVPKMISDLEKEKFKNGFGFENLLIDCSLLILDDFGSEFCSKFSSSSIYNIINSRLVKRMPTIVNTNLQMNEIEEFYNGKDNCKETGKRIVSRFMGEYKRLYFSGRDIRLQKLELSL
jgi:DNA replication protein DnaC